MSAIDPSKSRALCLAAQIEQQLKSEGNWILQFEQDIQTAREQYDAENDGYDSREKYPEKSFLEERYRHWTGIINAFFTYQTKLIDLSRDLNQKLTSLRWSNLDPATIVKLKFIHDDAGNAIDAAHSAILTKAVLFENNLNRIEQLAKKSITEINWMTNHPHLRLKQIIDRVNSGQAASSYISRVNDRLARNTYGDSTPWGSQT